MVCLRTFNAIWDWYKVPGTEDGMGIYAAENGNPKVWVPGKLYGNIKALEYAFECFHANKEPDWTRFLPFDEAYPWHAKREFINVDTSTNSRLYTMEKMVINKNGHYYQIGRHALGGWYIFEDDKPLKRITRREARDERFTLTMFVVNRFPPTPDDGLPNRPNSNEGLPEEREPTGGCLPAMILVMFLSAAVLAGMLYWYYNH